MFFDAEALTSFAENVLLVDEAGNSLTYGAVNARAQDFARRFSKGRGVLLLAADNSAATIVAFIAALQARCPIYLMSPQKAAEPDAAGPIPITYRYDPALDKLSVADLPDGGPELHPDLALLLSTSGSTGASKCVRLSRDNLDSNARAIADYLGLSAADRAPTNLPFFYSFGMSVVTSHLSVGGSLYVTERSLLEPGFWAGFDAQRCTSIAAVPHVIEMLEASGIRTGDHPSLRYMTQAGGKLSPERVKQLAERSAAEGWRFFVMYGQTEAAPRMAYMPPDLARDFPDCMGQAIPGGKFELLDEDGAPITEPDVPGELVYRGPNVMMGYALSPDDLAKGSEVEALHTGDIATRNAQGLYRIVGRKSRFIKPFGLRISLDEVDAWLATRGVAAVSGAGRGEALCLLHEPSADIETLIGALAEWLGIPRTGVRPIPVEALPRGANGKIDGKAVREIIAADEAAKPPAPTGPAPATSAPAVAPVAADAGLSPSEAKVAAVWRDALGVESVSRTDSFFDIGGDSLSAITVALRAEQHGMPPEMMHFMFEGRTVAEIAALLDGASRSELVRSRTALLGDTINITRGFLVLVVIAAHWVPFFIVRAGAYRDVLGRYSEFAFHLGTPGFAMVFGIGVSFFYMPMFERSPERFAGKVWSNTALLGGGVLLLGAVLAARYTLMDLWQSSIWPEQFFFNIIFAYFIMLPTVPLLIRAVRLTPQTIVNSLLLGALGLGVLLACQAALGPVRLTGFANLGKLMLTSAYSYPQMLATVGVGMAIGQWLRERADAPDLLQRCVLTGLLLVFAGSEFLVYTGGFFAHPREPQAFIFYTGVLLLLFALVLKLVELGAAGWLTRPLMLIGLLSFPAFIGHGLVIPLKDIAVALGVPYALALLGAVGLFLLFAAYAMLRLNRIYFASTSKSAGAVTPATASL